MISPFDYWPNDPDGYFRHFAIGFVVGCVFGRKAFLLAFLLAVSKEVFDLFFSFYVDPLDVVWTLVGARIVRA